MTLSTSVNAFVGRLERYQKAVERAPNVMLRDIAKVGRPILQVEAQKAAGGDSRLSHVGKSGAHLGVSVKIDNTSRTVTFKAAGPWHFVENRIRPHVIASKRFQGPRRGRGTKVAAGGARLRRGYVGRREAALRTPYGPRMFVKHPGVRNPKKPWAKGSARVLQVAPIVAAEAAKNELHKL